jgi:hypothetical protein
VSAKTARLSSSQYSQVKSSTIPFAYAPSPRLATRSTTRTNLLCFDAACTLSSVTFVCNDTSSRASYLATNKPRHPWLPEDTLFETLPQPDVHSTSSIQYLRVYTAPYIFYLRPSPSLYTTLYRVYCAQLSPTGITSASCSCCLCAWCLFPRLLPPAWWCHCSALSPHPKHSSLACCARCCRAAVPIQCILG